ASVIRAMRSFTVLTLAPVTLAMRGGWSASSGLGARSYGRMPIARMMPTSSASTCEPPDRRARDSPLVSSALEGHDLAARFLPRLEAAVKVRDVLEAHAAQRRARERRASARRAV